MDGGAWGGRSVNDLGQRPTPRQAAPPGAAARLLFRFGLGLAGLARERMGAILATSGAVEGGPAALEADGGQAAPRVADAALGLVLDAADAGLRARPALSARWAVIAASARRLSAPLVRACGLVGWLPGVPRRAAELRAWRAKEGRRLASWAAVGRRERARSRALTRAALSTLREALLGRLAERPDVNPFTRGESAEIEMTAVAELRERVAVPVSRRL
jgi:hypothetical protein